GCMAYRSGTRMTIEVDDLITALARIRVSFKALGLPVPEAICFATPDDGLRFWKDLVASGIGYPTYHVGNEPGVSPVEGENGRTYMQVEIYGLKVRWPAQLWNMPNGEVRYG